MKSFESLMAIEALHTRTASRLGWWVLGMMLWSAVAPARAGLYYSAETFADLPSQWRGFLLDQRTLRQIAVVPKAGTDESPARTRYLEEAAKLQKKDRPSAADKADLGALYVRLGEIAKAVAVLREAQREHPNHFFIAANLGTALHLQGDLPQAADALRDAVRLAPGKLQAAEELHLKLVHLRQRPMPGPTGFDDLFGVRFVNDQGVFEPGTFAAAEKKKLPARAAALTQQLALWLPADGPLLWQLAEIANAHGDPRTAAALLDGCVVQFNMNHPELRRRRQRLREAVDSLPKLPVGAKGEHEDQKHAGTLAFRSKRPLVSRLDATPLPPISDTGVNELPWQLFTETTVDAKFRPTFPTYLRELAGKKVALNGFIQPLRDDPEMTGFMFIEYPVGCWYCEMPDTANIVYVELPAGKTAPYQRGLIRVVGRLALNSTDPEDFLYAIRDARVGGVD